MQKLFRLYKIESPNFVLLFMPIEPAFAVALNQDAQLHNFPLKKYRHCNTNYFAFATLKHHSMWINLQQTKRIRNCKTSALLG
jgi:DNA recombination protein RmuC